MAEPQLNLLGSLSLNSSTQTQQFSLSVSFLQRGALLILYAVVLSSFLVWPNSSNFFYEIFKCLVLALTIAIFIYCWRRLSGWSCVLSLEDNGSGTLTVDAINHSIMLSRKAMISPLFCVVFLHNTHTDSAQMLVVWSDMLDDTHYRNLCRLLHSH